MIQWARATSSMRWRLSKVNRRNQRTTWVSCWPVSWQRLSIMAMTAMPGKLGSSAGECVGAGKQGLRLRCSPVPAADDDPPGLSRPDVDQVQRHRPEAAITPCSAPPNVASKTSGAISRKTGLNVSWLGAPWFNSPPVVAP